MNLHVSVRPGFNTIVRNHFYQNTWGTEERFGGCPIKYNDQFELLILAETNSFKVSNYKCENTFVKF